MIPAPEIDANAEIVLPDNSRYVYTVSPFEMTNALGNVVAILQEYTFTKIGDNNGISFCKLYRTKEGNWYEINTMNPSSENTVLRYLKTAFDLQENSMGM
jgi:hypothetical protein